MSRERVKQWFKRLKHVSLWRLIFICPFNTNTCLPTLHRDDVGVWNACRLCGKTRPRHELRPFFGKRTSEGIEIAPNPYERPSLFHFECPVCHFSDDDSRRLAGPLDIFCTLCWHESEKANPLVRWPPIEGQTRQRAYDVFVADKAAYRAVNDGYPADKWKPGDGPAKALDKPLQ